MDRHDEVNFFAFLYDISLLQLGLHPVAVVGKFVQKNRIRDSYIQKEKQYTKQYKTRNTQNRKQTTQENEYKNNIENRS